MSDADFDWDGEIDAKTLREIDRICGDFEREFKTNPKTRMEAFLGQVPERAFRRGFRDLIETEIELRSTLGDMPTATEFVERFPNHEFFIKNFFIKYEETKRESPGDAGEEPEDPLFSKQPVDDENPQMIGRYRVLQRIEKGGFGIVYLAEDLALPRKVALKVPRKDRVRTTESKSAFMRDAQIASTLAHPHIVQVLSVDTAETPEGTFPFIVMPYLAGGDLRQRLQNGSASPEQIVTWMIPISEAISVAHQKGIFHRDLKPANILFDEYDKPYVADFGLALHVREQWDHKKEFAGTLPYMSPESVLGEAHRLDGRADIWSLGVILYEALTGERPFHGDTEILKEQIIDHEPRPVRQIKPVISGELARICLKCLEKQRKNRYETAFDLAADLRNWRESINEPKTAAPTEVESIEADNTPPVDSGAERPARIVPKGLRAYDRHDAAFFRELLPGPFDKNGLPECIRFWKTRIDVCDPEQTFAVGVLHGPSGCGKSSLVRAGIIPALDPHVITIIVEATAIDTEVRLIKSLRRQFPRIPDLISLPQILAGIRERKWGPAHKKVLLIFDQFEQWMTVENLQDRSQIVEGLRHCDGERLQGLLLVREDFWSGISRFMQQLEIPLLEFQNAMYLDRFDMIHARRVLEYFGRAYDRLPATSEELNSEQKQFLDEVVGQLSEGGRVISVRLSLFSEMFKARPWTIQELTSVGGVHGIGIKFLEETFAAKTALAANTNHQQAVRKLFEALLPSDETNIKGNMRSSQELQELCGYADKPHKFRQLIRILDSELRLITRTDPEGLIEARQSANSAPVFAQDYYQFSHDYLVPSVREWLKLEDGRTRKGRAWLLLKERARMYALQSGDRQLPTFWEHLRIRWHIPKKERDSKHHQMLQRAVWVHGLRFTYSMTAFAVVCAVVLSIFLIQKNRADKDREENRRRNAQLLVETALEAPPDAVPYAAENIEPLRNYALPLLQRQLVADNADSQRRLRAAILLARFGKPQVDLLIDSIPTAESRECPNLVAALEGCGPGVTNSLRQTFRQAAAQQDHRLMARLALTSFYLHDDEAAREMLQLRSDPGNRVVLINTVPQWHISPEIVLNSILESESSPFRSGMLLGVGSIPASELSPARLHNAVPLLTRLFREMPDAGTHSAAGWVLGQWGQPLPDLPARQSNDREWNINCLGMTLVKIPIPIDPQHQSASSRPTRSIWLCDSEIAARLFQKFMDDPDCAAAAKPTNWPGADVERSPTPDHPVQRVSWIDAVLFCNWLSRLEHRQECYAWDGKDWQLIPQANGYRLPSEYEWEHACRAGTTTEFVSGESSEHLARYAVIRSNQTAVCRSKMPNPWGLFDMHGNVYEWCQDWFVENEQRAIRSGAFDYGPARASSANRQSNYSEYRSYTIGFRVACFDD